MTDYAVPFNRQDISNEDIEAVARALRDPWITRGPKVQEFEEAVATYTGHQHAIAVCHGTCALRLVLSNLGSRRVDPKRLAVRFEAGAPYDGIIHAIPERFDRYGSPAQDLCRHALAMVTLRECYAQISSSWFGEVPNHYVATGRVNVLDASRAFGHPSLKDWDYVTLSFHPLKTITTGEGGMVLTNDEGLAQDVRAMRTGDFQTGLGNYWMTDFQAALGLSQLHRIDGFLTKRRAIASRYIAAGIVPGHEEYEDSVWNVAPFYPPLAGRSADRTPEEVVDATWRTLGNLVAYLGTLGVEAQLPRPLLRDDPRGHFLALPIYPSMTDAQVDAVIGAVHVVQRH